MMPVPDYLAGLRDGVKQLRIGLPRKFFYEDLDPEIASAVEQALGVLRTLGCDLSEIEIEVPTDRTLQTAESYAYHAEFASRSPELYQPETLRRIRKGEDISAAEVEQSRRELKQIRSEIHKIFEGVDVLVTPTTPVPAAAIDELKQNPDLLRPHELIAAPQYPPGKCVGTARDLGSLRIHHRRPSDRASNHRSAMAGRHSSTACVCLRAGHGLAQTESEIG